MVKEVRHHFQPIVLRTVRSAIGMIISSIMSVCLSGLSVTLCIVAKPLTEKLSEQVNRKCPPRNMIL